MLSTQQASRLILRVILVILAGAALCGIAIVMSGANDLTARLMGTAVVNLVACLIVLFALRNMRWPMLRPLALAVMVQTLLSLGFWLLAIWIGLGRNISDEWRYFVMAGTWTFTGYLGVMVFWFWGRPGGKWSYWVGLVTALLAMFCFQSAIWAFDGEKWVITGNTIAASGTLLVVCLMGLGVDKDRHWRWLGVGSALLAGFILEANILAENRIRPGNVSEKIVTTCYCLALVIAYINIMLRIRLVGWQLILRRAGIVLLALTLGLLVVNVVLELRVDDDILWRWLAMGILVVVAATLAQFILARMQRMPAAIMPVAPISSLRLECPVCAARLQVPVMPLEIEEDANPSEGPAPRELGQAVQCPTCNLILRIQAQTPQCRKCGYVLHHMHGPACPECGSPVDQRPPDAQLLTPGNASAAAPVAPAPTIVPAVVGEGQRVS